MKVFDSYDRKDLETLISLLWACLRAVCLEYKQRYYEGVSA